jgi:bifunctional non-homologous end joining protein LigD
MARIKVPLQVAGREMQVSNLDQVLFPKSGFKKADVINYYIKVSKLILPHLRNRPLTLKLYYHGVEAPADYEKDAPSYTPKWVKRAPIWRKTGESQIHFVLVNDLPTLVWAANLANIEMHPFLARWPKIDRPDFMVFDLDPGEPAGALEAAQVAVWLAELLSAMKLKSFVKSAGSKGLHVYVPFNTPVSYQQTQSLAKAMAELLTRRHPEIVVSEMAKKARAGKVFVDWSQNAEHKSTVAVYSLRAKGEEPFVSMPISWPTLKRALSSRDPARFCITPDEALKRVSREGDIFAPTLHLRQKIPAKLL